VPASGASASRLLGEQFTPSDPCDPGYTYLQTASSGAPYSAPDPGVITSWSFRADATPPQLKLEVARPAGGNDYTTVGVSSAQTPTANTLNTYPVRIPVQAGDVIGLYLLIAGHCGIAPFSGYGFHYLAADPGPGTTATYVGPAPGKVAVAALLEPDCDGDGFGDETQDNSVDCAPPETQITKGPKAKTHRKKAKFEFSSSEPSSSFECSLNGGPFESCSSPATVKSKKGKNDFAIRARDAAGNVDGSPASFDWKFKKKRKRK
jgi:hypothetical protein